MSIRSTYPVFANIHGQTQGIFHSNVDGAGLRPVPRHRILVGSAILRTCCLYRVVPRL